MFYGSFKLRPHMFKSFKLKLLYILDPFKYTPLSVYLKHSFIISPYVWVKNVIKKKKKSRHTLDYVWVGLTFIIIIYIWVWVQDIGLAEPNMFLIESRLIWFWLLGFLSMTLELDWTELGSGVKWIAFPGPTCYGLSWSNFFILSKQKQKTVIYLLK